MRNRIIPRYRTEKENNSASVALSRLLSVERLALLRVHPAMLHCGPLEQRTVLGLPVQTGQEWGSPSQEGLLDEIYFPTIDKANSQDF